MKKTQGIAFVTILILVVVSTSLVSVTTLFALSSRSSSTDNLATIQAQYAAEAGIENMIDLAMYGAQRNMIKLRNDAGLGDAVILDSCAFKLLLTGQISGNNNNSAQKVAGNVNSTTTCAYAWDTKYAETAKPDVLVTPPMPNLLNNTTLTDAVANPFLAGIVGDAVYTVRITRNDDPVSGDTRLRFQSTGQVKSGTNILATRVLSREIMIAGDPYPGDRFAMLTTASNCSFCHLYIDTMERAYDNTADKKYDRALVGLLNTNSTKTNFCGEWHRDSVIAGTLYVRQNSFSSGQDYNCSTVDSANHRVLGFKWAGTGADDLGKVLSGSIDTAKGNWLGVAGGTANEDAVAIDASSATGSITKFGKVYYNYPTQANVANAPWNNTFPDEPMPSDFPAVIRDTNNNQMVDDAEWTLFKNIRPGASSLSGGIVAGFKRPSTTSSTLSSYDPLADENAAFQNTTLVNGGLSARTQFMQALETLRTNNYTAAALATFATNWRGWLLQQALATPNNRDYFPTNPTAYSTLNYGQVVGTTTSISGATVGGATVQAVNVNLTTALTGTSVANANSTTGVALEFFDPANPTAARPMAFLLGNGASTTTPDVATLDYATGGRTLSLSRLSSGLVNNMQVRLVPMPSGYNSRAFVDAPLTSASSVTAGVGSLTMNQVAVTLPMRVFGTWAFVPSTRLEFYNPTITDPDTDTTMRTAFLAPQGATTGTPDITTANNNQYAAGNQTLSFHTLSGTGNIPATWRVRIYVNWFEPISWGDQSRTGALPNTTGFYGSQTSGTGALENNFHVRFDPGNATTNASLSLVFCTVVNPFGNSRDTICPNPVTLNLTDVDDQLLFPQTSDATTVTELNKGYYDGNVILDGGRIGDTTGTKVLNLQGTVLVNGDVVIRGYISGKGRLIARGNIYIVGDFVYWCGRAANNTGGAPCTRQQYQELLDLPQIGLLAGGGIFAGDYDIGDGNGRSSNLWDDATGVTRRHANQMDLINDQTMQLRSPSDSTITPSYYNIPGATGNTPNGTASRGFAPQGDSGTNSTAGFLNEILPPMNSRTNVRKFLYAPFGLIANDNSRAATYENKSTSFFLTTVSNSSIVPIAPSNGPLALGNTTGLANATTGASGNISCSQSAFNTNSDPVLPSVFNTLNSVGLSNASAWRASFNFSYWCRPVGLTGDAIRADRINNATPDISAPINTPFNDVNAWMLQPPQNAALDGNVGMTTGWLGGLLGYNNSTNVYTQLGDLSQTRIIKLMWLSTMEGRNSAASALQRNQMQFRTDGILYSPQAVFGFVRSRTSGGDGSIETPTTTQGRWVHNGSMISFELGFLAPGPYGDRQGRFTTKTNISPITFGPLSTTVTSDIYSAGAGGGMTILYDKRMSGFLNISSGIAVKIKPLGGYTQLSR
jgi:hypothetical protein